MAGSLHEQIIAGICSEALLRVSQPTRVRILRRLLKIALVEEEPRRAHPGQLVMLDVLGADPAVFSSDTVCRRD